MTDRLTEADQEVLDCVTEEGRVNAELLSAETSLDAETAERALHRLVSSGLVEEVGGGLYQSVDAPQSDDEVASQRGIPDPNPETQTAPIDPTELEGDER